MPRQTAHEHDHGHDHPHRHGHGHGHGTAIGAAMDAGRDGMRTLAISLVVLLITAAIQAVVAVLSGSVALLGDTLHNAGDGLTALPLGVAFLLGRRAPNRRYTYGYGRAEDLAGISVVLVIAVSAALSGYLSVRRLAHPHTVDHLPAVAVAAVVGFVGNEWVAWYRIRTGRRIGSAALVADGLHARTDGFTSLAVLVGAGGVALGMQRADAIVGLLITVAILKVLGEAAREVYHRLMDAVDPDLVATAESAAAATPGVVSVDEVRLRWIGHELRAEVHVAVSAELSVSAAHEVAVTVEQAMVVAVPRLTVATVHADPDTAPGRAHHVG